MKIIKSVVLYKNDYDFSKVKTVKQMSKVLEYIMNTAFTVSNPKFYEEFHELLGSTGEYIDMSEPVTEWEYEEE